MSSETFSNELVNGLSITGISVTETDIGSVDPFVGASLLSFGTYTGPVYSGIGWSGFGAGAVAPGSTLALDFQYTVTDTNPGLLITSLQDTFSGSGSPGTTLTVTENVYSDAAHTNLIGSITVDLGHEADPPYQATDTPLTAGYQTVYVDLQVDASVSAGAPSNSQVTFSILDQGFAQSGISVDKQISVDGGKTWIEQGTDILQNPPVLAGTAVLERVIVTNTGTNAITGASASDSGSGPANFLFSGNANFNLAIGGSTISDVATVVAGSGYQTDEASASGTVTIASKPVTIGSTDTANFTGETAGITIDKQISVNGGAWMDVTPGNGPTVLAGATITEQVIVVNTGSVAISGAAVSDSDSYGLSGFTFNGGSPTTVIAVGSTVTSDVATIIAGTGYQPDTATVTGSVSDSYGDTGTVTASSSANFTGETAGITIDKQISVNGGAWMDVTPGNGPTVLAGATITEQVIVVNTGSVAITGASVSDSDSYGLSGFTFGGAGSTIIAVGGTVTSDVATVIAGTGYQPDTATVTGSVSDSYGDTGTVTASSSANFTGETAGITLDKQISVNGGAWMDIGNDMTDPLVLAGATITEQVVITNTGSVGIENASIGDVGAGPGSFTVGGAATFSLGAGDGTISDVATVIAGSGYQTDTATLTGTAFDSYGDTASVSATDSANFTGETYGITIDKQISTDGVNWLDQGDGNIAQDPTIAAGSNVYERVVLINTGAVEITNASVSDVDSDGLAGFTFGSASSTTLAVGQTLASDIATVTAGSIYSLDTATVTGTVSDSYGDTGSVTASDIANYTGSVVVPVGSITVDKQISVDGCIWLDVGDGNLSQDPTVLAGTTLYERVIVVNDTSTTLNSGQVVDAGSGVSGFTFGGGRSPSSTFTLAAGQTIVSNVSSFVAASGTQYDTATATGTITVGGSKTTETAQDTAGYVGTLGSITVDKQISVDGCTWLDVGDGNLSQDPNVLAGTTLYERVIVVNDTSTTLNNGQVTDSGSGPSGFTFGGGRSPSSTFTLAAGQTIVSNVASFVAGSGTQYDTATATGTITVGGSKTTETAQDTAGYAGTLGSITVDKQISVDGCTWLDVGDGNLSQDPTVLAGTTLYERVIVVNDTSTTLNSGQVVDAGSGPSGFTFGGGRSPSSTFTLAAGQTIVSNVASFVAGIGTQYDTATAIGTITVGGSKTTETAQDTAGYVGTAGSITVDKQISVDGCTWLDVGNGNLSQDPNVLAGTTLYERVIVVNDTSTTLNNGQVVDAGSGPSGFTFGSGRPSSTFTLSAGQTIVSNVASFVAGSGTQYDTATATGTITVGGSKTTETAQDTAGYVGTAGSITVDKQISVDGCTWLDIGNGNLSNSPIVASGATLYERVIVVNDTGETLNNGQVLDAGSGPSGFTFGSGRPSSTFSLGAGQTIVSNVASFTATIGTQYDTATATGTVTVGGSSSSLSAQDDASYIGTVLSNGKITGTVWNDSNDDGQIDCGESGRGGVTVDLLNNNGSVIATATTNGSGNYSFGSLAGGTYSVEFVAPNGQAFSPPGGDSDAGPGGVTAPITITGSQTSANNDAGLVPLPSPSTNLVSAYGKPSQIEFLYQPGNTVSNSQGGQASVSGSNSNTTAFIAVSNNSNPFAGGASIYTDQSITAGQDFLTQVAASSNGSKTYVDIFTSQAAFNAHQAPIQTSTYVTGGSQAIHLNDTIGSVKVAGYVGQNGGFLT